MMNNNRITVQAPNKFDLVSLAYGCTQMDKKQNCFGCDSASAVRTYTRNNYSYVAPQKKKLLLCSIDSMLQTMDTRLPTKLHSDVAN